MGGLNFRQVRPQLHEQIRESYQLRGKITIQLLRSSCDRQGTRQSAVSRIVVLDLLGYHVDPYGLVIHQADRNHQCAIPKYR